MSGVSPVLLVGVMLTVFSALAIVPVFLLMRSSEESKRLMEVTKAPLRLRPEAEPRGNRYKQVLLRVARFLRLPVWASSRMRSCARSCWQPDCVSLPRSMLIFPPGWLDRYWR